LGSAPGLQDTIRSRELYQALSTMERLAVIGCAFALGGLSVAARMALEFHVYQNGKTESFDVGPAEGSAS
jgi:hypothetical protein